MTNTLKERLNMNSVRKLFTDGIKLTKADFKVGFEYERLPVCKETKTSALYNGLDGVCEFLRLYARNENWDYLLDEENIIGLKKLHDTITLEPGMQMELSLEPQKTIQEIEQKVKDIDKSLIPLMNDFDMELLNYGISPISLYNSIKLLPKRRYKIMANYLWGILSDVMMRETAGIQACFDFDSEDDAMKKFRVANMLSPFATAMFANSPIRGGVETGYKTFRALSWLNTDTERCGFATNFSKDFCFEDYINLVFETPVIMIQRESRTYAVNGTMTLKQFINGEIQGQTATLDDFKLCANLYFPDVRLRKFVEIRNHDCVGNNLQYAMLAFYKGIMYSKTALEDVENIFEKCKYKDFADLRYNIPKYAMEADFKKTKVKAIAKELVNISEQGLKSQNTDEEKYLEPLQDLVYQGKCPADIILENWNGCWNHDINKLIEYTRACKF